jgi:hypothetical protein
LVQISKETVTLTVFQVKEHVHVRAPIERCFELARSVELAGEMAGVQVTENGIARSHGQVQAGDHMIWKGWSFGLPARHESVVTRVEAPRALEDRMVRGRFRRFEQIQSLSEIDDHTLVTATVRFVIPRGLPGRLLARHLVIPSITRMLQRRMNLLKETAEGKVFANGLPGEA